MGGKKVAKGKGKAASTPSKLATAGKKGGAGLSEKELKKVSGGTLVFPDVKHKV